jgi:hypothetical protein
MKVEMVLWRVRVQCRMTLAESWGRWRQEQERSETEGMAMVCVELGSGEARVTRAVRAWVVWAGDGKQLLLQQQMLMMAAVWRRWADAKLLWWLSREAVQTTTGLSKKARRRARERLRKAAAAGNEPAERQQPQPTIGLEAELGTEEMEAELRRQLGIRGLREGEVHPTDTVNVKVMGDALTALQKRKGIWSAQQQIKTDELMGAVHMVMHQLKVDMGAGGCERRVGGGSWADEGDDEEEVAEARTLHELRLSSSERWPKLKDVWDMSALELTALWDAAEEEASSMEGDDAGGRTENGDGSQRAVSVRQLREWEQAYGSGVRRQDGTKWKDRLEVAEDLKMARQSLAAWHSYGGRTEEGTRLRRERVWRLKGRLMQLDRQRYEQRVARANRGKSRQC